MFRSSRTIVPAFLLATLPMVGQAPVVNADKSVTFRLNAPFADKVYVGGEFDDKFNRPPGALMTKDANGVWTFTSKPVESGSYFYGYAVDELFILDPANTKYRTGLLRANPTNNILEVRGGGPFGWEVARDTPRGSVHVEEFHSPTLNRFANAYVYTPPGYAADAARSFPVLYLLHGNTAGELGGTSREWVFFGFANKIMDNLIAAGKAREMIVVMVDSQSPISATLTTLASYELFEKYFVEEVVPLVESRYRIDGSKASRWMAGLSRGGAQTFHVAFRHPEMFSALGAFSIALPATFPDAYPIAADTPTLNGQFSLIYYSCGREDSNQLAGYERSTALLSQRGIRFEPASFPGGHIWQVWRDSLADFVSRLK
jgi:enterochelin esterase family protein